MRLLRFALVPAAISGAMLIFDGAGSQLWLTALAGGILVSGALAAARGRTWGIFACFFVGVAALMAPLLEMAPSIFFLYGAAGVFPFGLYVRAMLKRDRGAVLLLVSLLVALAGAALYAWNHIFLWIVRRWPHAFASFNKPLASIVLGAVALATFAYVARRRGDSASPTPDVLRAEAEGGKRRVVVGLGDQDVLAIGHAQSPVAIDLIIEPDSELGSEDERALREAPPA